jgi:hypothetical protein
LSCDGGHLEFIINKEERKIYRGSYQENFYHEIIMVFGKMIFAISAH